jgi:hypothetical protein
MRVRRLWVLGSLVVLWAGEARATDHVLDLFVAPYTSYVKAKGSSIDLGGWHFSAAVSAKKKIEKGDGKEKPDQFEPMKLSFVGDVSVHFYGSDGDKDVTQTTVMVGPRWTFLKDKKLLPFAQGMILGAVYRSDGSTAPSSVAGALSGGVGVDIPYSMFGNEHDNGGVRVQADYIWPFATQQEGSWRVSVGLLYRFH